MVPFDVRKMMFFLVPRISFEKQSFPEFVGRSIEKPTFYYKTMGQRQGEVGLVSQTAWPCDG